MNDQIPTCILCQGKTADRSLERVQVWEDPLWRLTTSLFAEVPGFSYLEPKRHIPDITALDGAEASTLGEVLSRVTRVLREETGAELVYVYIFGGSVPHLHIHLAPHHPGDALNDAMIRGELVSEKQESGVMQIISKEFPPLPVETLSEVAGRIRQRLAGVA